MSVVKLTFGFISLSALLLVDVSAQPPGRPLSRRIEIETPARAVAYLNDGTLLIVDQSGRLFTHQEEKTTGPVANGLGDVRRIAVSDNNEIAVLKADGSLSIVKLVRRGAVRPLNGTAKEPIIALTFTPDQRVVGLGSEGTRYVWSAAEDGGFNAEPRSAKVDQLLAMSKGGDYFVARTPEGRLALWDARSQQILKVYENSGVAARAAAISDTRSFIAVADAVDPAKIMLWNMGDGSFNRLVNVPGAEKVAVFFTQDDDKLVTLDITGLIRTFHTGTGEQICERPGGGSGANEVVFSSPKSELAQVQADGSVNTARFLNWSFAFFEPGAPEAEQPKRFVTVPVYFGTNRGSTGEGSVWEEFKGFFKTTLGIGSVVVAVVLIAIAGLFKGTAARIVALGAVLLIPLIGVLDAIDRVRQQSEAPQGVFNNDCENLQFGRCEVTVPRSHSIGQLEAPPQFWIFRADADPNTHIILQNIERFTSEDAFAKELRGTFDKNNQGYDAFVFIHGYNTPFDEAARRTAQLAYDLEFPGAPVFFSWPSHGEASLYSRDLRNAEASVPDLREFLRALAQKSGAKRIHLIAHSMGSMLLGRTLQGPIVDGEAANVFRYIVLAAPDIDQQIFIEQIAPAMVQNHRQVTLYASSEDTALTVSRQIHGRERAGDARPKVLLIKGVETIDASGIDTSFVGHSYFASAKRLLTDLGYLLIHNKPAGERFGLFKQAGPDGEYWLLQRQP